MAWTLNQFNDWAKQQSNAPKQALATGGWDAVFANAKPTTGLDMESALYSGNQFFNPFGTATPYSADQVRTMQGSMPMSMGEGGRQVLYKGKFYENPFGGNMAMWNAMSPEQRTQMVSGIQGAGAGTWREQDYMSGGGTPVPGFDQLGANTGSATTVPGYGINPPGGVNQPVPVGGSNTTPQPSSDSNVGIGKTSYGSAHDNAMLDPSFGFRLGEGLKAIQGSAAAKGTLHSGGTLKDLNNYAQGMASTEYGNAFDRALRQANFDYGVDRDDRSFDYGVARDDRAFDAELARFLTEVGFRGTDAATRSEVDLSRLIAGLLESQGQVTGTGTIARNNNNNEIINGFLRLFS